MVARVVLARGVLDMEAYAGLKSLWASKPLEKGTSRT